MNLSKRVFTLIICILLISVTSCKKDKRKLPSALNFVELNRGDLILCYGEQFGDVNFSLSCDYSVRETFDLAIGFTAFF